MMNYEEKYGEKILSDEEERELQEKINMRERIEQLEQCVERLKEILKSEGSSEDLLSEMQYEINCLE